MDTYTGRHLFSAAELDQFIEKNALRSIRVGFSDLLGVQRGKLIPVSNAKALLDPAGKGLMCSSAVMALGYDDEFVDASFLPDKRDDFGIAADLSTLELLPYAQRTAFVQGDLIYGGKPFAAGPRSFLKDVVDRYHALG